MSVLDKIIGLLVPYANDIIPIADIEILQFTKNRNITLREDHFHFLMKYGSKSGERLHIFKNCGGDFDFQHFKRTYESAFDIGVPQGNVFFGMSFVGEFTCIDNVSGGIYIFDENHRYGMLYESIDGFVFRCLLLAYAEKTFTNRILKSNLQLEYINEFRLMNEKHKINGATFFKSEYKFIDNPEVVTEYYLINRELILLHISTKSMGILSGGILEQLTASNLLG